MFICHEHLAVKHTLIVITTSYEYNGLITSITICCMQTSVNICGIVEAYRYVYNKLVLQGKCFMNHMILQKKMIIYLAQMSPSSFLYDPNRL